MKNVLKVLLMAVMLSATGVPALAADPGIQWFGTWEAGVREAARTGRPILLVSGAPHCHNVSGIW